MATVSPIVAIPSTRVTKMKAGRSAQKAGPKSNLKPSQPNEGTPNQGAAITASMSYTPNNAAAVHPATIPMIGAQMRQKADPRNRIAVTASTVTAAITGAAAPCSPAGMSVSKLKMMGMIVTVTRMIVVPATVGVMIRRTRGNWPASKNRKSDETHHEEGEQHRSA